MSVYSSEARNDEDVIKWNQQRPRTNSVVLLQRTLLKNKYVQKDPINIDDVYSVRKTLAFCMKMSIKKSVTDEVYVRRELTPEDFLQIKKIKFEADDPANRIQREFKFTDYAPVVFKALRHNFEINEKEYLDSLTETELDNFQSGSKSGCFFFFSGDGQYMIKGTTKKEANFFLSMLQDYCGHMRRSLNSLLVRFCGLYRLKVPHIRKMTHFIVMRSVYSESQFHPCTVVYDLKGSTTGRKAHPNAHVRKDLDFIEERMKRDRKLHLGDQRTKNTFMAALKNDVAWLQKSNIMDYSLLVGIHDPRDNDNQQLALNYRSGRFEEVDLARMRQSFEENRKMERRLKTKLPRFSVINSGGGREETYYIAIIDILQPYNTKKKAENFLKSMFFDGNSISAVPAKQYGERFYNFIAASITCESQESNSGFSPPMEVRNPSSKSGKKTNSAKDAIYGVL